MNNLEGTEGVIGLTVESCGNGIRNQTQTCQCYPPPPPVAPPTGPLVELAAPIKGEIIALKCRSLIQFQDGVNSTKDAINLIGKNCKCQEHVSQLIEKIAMQNAQLSKLNQLIATLENRNFK